MRGDWSERSERGKHEGRLEREVRCEESGREGGGERR